MKQVAVIGAGASGCVCAYYLIKAGVEVTLFDVHSPLLTLLPTGGGRCNLAHAEFDYKELAKNYPRGEKFLYSVFSAFSTYDTLALFSELGVETYTQEDGRIFPVSNSAKEVQSKILEHIKGADFVKEAVNEIHPADGGYKIKTNKAEYFFPTVVISTGGGLKSHKIKGLPHKIVPCTPALVGLRADIKKELSGISIENVYSHDYKISGDLLFTHYGISGPLAYKISSLKSKDNYPYELTFDFYQSEYDLQEELNSNPHKLLKNILGQILPNRFAEYIAGDYADVKGHNINGKIRDEVLKRVHNFKLTVTGCDKGEETVTAGGYDLDEINSKTMESKLCKDLYITGEALDIDGFCGGFNLQNAWSTAYVAAESIINKI